MTDHETTADTDGVTLLWMESTRAGAAARTHLDGTIERLRAESIPVAEIIRSESTGGGGAARIGRLFSLVRTARARAHAGVLIARWHPFLAFVSPRWIRRGGRVLLLVQGNDASAYEANTWLRKVPGVRTLMRRSLESASRILTVNEGLARWVREARAGVPAVPVDVMPSGVSDVFFDAEPIASDRPYALFFGGLATWQGVDYMLEAHRSAAWPEGVRLVVIGDGTMGEAVKAAASEGVEWLGALPPVEVARHVAGALCTLCPKSNTGSMATTTTPFKILESVAAGVPVVATDIPAQVDMLADGYGLLVSVDRPVELAEAVARLASDPALRAGLVEAARAVAPRYRWSTAARQLADGIRALRAG